MPTVPAPLAGDSVAIKTRWDPLVGGGANFRTRNLVSVNPDRMEFPASLSAKLFAGVFVLLGGGTAVMGGSAGHWFAIVFGVVFAGIGAGLLYFGTVPVVFDKRQGAFWKGRTAPAETYHRSSLKHYARLGDIHALQIIKERIRGSKSSYDSYELNLVLTDGRRLNVTDHGDYEALRTNAATLSTFLGLQVWDTVADEYFETGPS